MNYNDSQIMSDNAYIKCQSAYSKLSANTLHDLGEILEKLESQKKAIISANLETNPTNIIASIDDSILALKGIINSTQHHTQSTSKNINKFSSIPDTLEPYTYSESRADSISNYMDSAPPNETNTEPKNNQPNIPANPPNPTNPDSVSAPPSTATPDTSSKNIATRNTTSRGYPQQGSIITRLLSQLQINKAPNPTKVKSTRTQTQHTTHSIHNAILGNKNAVLNFPIYDSKHTDTHYPTNPYLHPTKPNPPPCTAEKDILSRQIDIVRLLILYLQLRPHYPYCYRICSIANVQFDILSTLINI